MTERLGYPTLVAGHIRPTENAVGERGRAIAGVDCGFAACTDKTMLIETIGWANFYEYCAGAAPAGSPLWG